MWIFFSHANVYKSHSLNRIAGLDEGIILKRKSSSAPEEKKDTSIQETNLHYRRLQLLLSSENYTETEVQTNNTATL